MPLVKSYPSIESLENRLVLATTLDVQVNPVLRHVDEWGNAIVFRVSGTSGVAEIREDLLDGFGNDDLVLDPGERIGAISLSATSVDFVFSAEYEEDPIGDWTRLGYVSAYGQTILGFRALASEGEAGGFAVANYQGDGFSAGGGLFVDAVLGTLDQAAVNLRELAFQARVHVDEDLTGHFLVADNLAGDVIVGGTWNGDLSIGGDLSSTGRIIVDDSLIGRGVVGGDFAGQMLLAGDLMESFSVLNHVTGDALIAVEGSIADFDVVRSFFGRMVATNSLTLSIGGNVGGTAAINTFEAKSTNVNVGEAFFGQIRSGETLNLTVAHHIAPDSKVISLGSATVLYGDRVFSTAVLQAPTLDVRNRISGSLSGIPLAPAPVVITQPGIYRLTNHLVYTRSSGVAVEIRANNVVLDLQGFSIVSTAGSSALTTGVRVDDRYNVTIRNGIIRGFTFGIIAAGPNDQGHTYQVLDLRLDSNWYFGIWIAGSASLVSRCIILDNGGATTASDYTVVIGIRASGAGIRVEDNIINGMKRSSINREWVGVHFIYAPGGRYERNVTAVLGSPTETYGTWTNGGPWRGSGSTDVSLLDNLFVGLEYTQALADDSIAYYSGNHYLRVGSGETLVQSANSQAIQGGGELKSPAG